ncbi:histidine kinase [Sporolactobacillus shoreicorticis]|uniref:histidine kinase n=1 Tax=Sporolactobacillus shoreicorticis TaxID=1923877 RepID=A0ABW5S9P3_9BACL|nr:ATP-binding protein [Sporolactobacillus shoreicorticis]MCO7127703.1 histidine kinase [Sporolactobacillus shoreicorticis]
MIKNIWQQWRRSILFLAALTYSLVLAGHFMAVILDRPYVGIYTVQENNQIKVRSVAPFSWAESADIRAGDRIVSVDGRRAGDNRNISNFGMVGQAKQITVARENSVYSLQIDNGTSEWALLFYLIIPLAFFTACFVAVLFLYLRKESSPVVRILIALLITVSPVLFEMSANARHDSWSLRLTSVAIVFTLIFLVHFLRNYFSVCGCLLVSNWLLVCLYLCGSLIVINSCFFTSREVSAYYQQELVFSVFVFGLLCIQLTRLYYQIRASEYGRIIHLLMAGFFLALFPFIALYALPNMFVGTSLVPVEWTTPWMIMLPVTLCYIVLSSALIDMSFYIGQFGYYCALSFAITLLILISFLGLVQRHITESPADVARLGALCFILGLIIFYIKEYTDYYFSKYLHPKKKERQATLNQFLQKSKTEYTLRHVDLMLRRAVLSQLPVEEAVLFLVSPKGRLRQVNKNAPLLMRHMSVIAENDFDLKKSNSGFTALLKDDRSNKVVLVGKWMKPGRSLTLDENMWLETLVSYARVVIDNLYKTEGLMQAFHHLENNRKRIPHAMNRWLFSISEQERAHLSRDMHDTNIQDQLAIAREIDAAVKKIRHPETVRRLSYIRERMLDNAEEMRKMIREWYPADIFNGRWGSALDVLFQRVNLLADFHLETHVADIPRSLSKEVILCLYRAIQELLSNAVKHAQASRVRLHLVFEGGSCLLHYQDDGKGLGKTAIDPFFSTTGLTGLISRVEGLGGNVTFGTMEKTAEGLSVQIHLPVNDKMND